MVSCRLGLREIGDVASTVARKNLFIHVRNLFQNLFCLRTARKPAETDIVIFMPNCRRINMYRNKSTFCVWMPCWMTNSCHPNWRIKTKTYFYLAQLSSSLPKFGINYIAMSVYVFLVLCIQILLFFSNVYTKGINSTCSRNHLQMWHVSLSRYPI